MNYFTEILRILKRRRVQGMLSWLALPLFGAQSMETTFWPFTVLAILAFIEDGAWECGRFDRIEKRRKKLGTWEKYHR